MALSGSLLSDLILFRRFLATLQFSSPYDFSDVIRMELDLHPETGNMVIVTAALTPGLSDFTASLSMQGRGVSLLIVPKAFVSAASSQETRELSGIMGGQGQVVTAAILPEILRPPSPAPEPGNAEMSRRQGEGVASRV